MPTDIFCNDPQHQGLAEQIYKRGLELLEEKKHSENLLYNISEAVIAINHDSKINIVNKAAEDLIGLNASSLEGQDVQKFLNLNTEKGEAVAPEQYCFKPEDIELQNLMFESKSGTKYLKLQSTTIINPQNKQECIITLTDVTREKMLEKTKDEFISIASHELRTPMTVIKSYLWMLENGKHGELNNKQKEYLQKAQGGVQRMLVMINDTLNASKIDQGTIQLKMEEIDLREFLKQIEQDFRLKTSEKGLNFKIVLESDSVIVYSDRGKLEELLTNLLGNSIKFTSTGGVTLNISKQDDSYLKFSVTDTGKGINPSDIEKLFHKFGRIDNSYQTVAEAGGTGLGLYIVKNTVESMGGKVGAYSEGLGKGSTFWLTLPCTYCKIPDKLKENSIVSLAPATTVAETHITSICPL